MTTDNQADKEYTPDYIRKFLKEPPLLLRNFHHEDTMEFLQLGEMEHYMRDEIVVSEPDYINSAYLITSGKVSVWKDNIQLNSFSTGSTLGETFLFSKNNRLGKVVAEGKVQLLRFERYEALNFFRRKPEKLFNIFTRNIIEIQQQNINNMNSQILQLKKRLLENKNW